MRTADNKLLQKALSSTFQDQQTQHPIAKKGHTQTLCEAGSPIEYLKRFKQQKKTQKENTSIAYEDDK